LLICQQVEKDFENKSENDIHDNNAPPSEREQGRHCADERSLSHTEEKLKQENENGTFHDYPLGLLVRIIARSMIPVNNTAIKE
jgi:hypothetical protein